VYLTAGDTHASLSEVFVATKSIVSWADACGVCQCSLNLLKYRWLNATSVIALAGLDFAEFGNHLIVRIDELLNHCSLGFQTEAGSSLAFRRNPKIDNVLDHFSSSVTDKRWFVVEGVRMIGRDANTDQIFGFQLLLEAMPGR